MKKNPVLGFKKTTLQQMRTEMEAELNPTIFVLEIGYDKKCKDIHDIQQAMINYEIDGTVFAFRAEGYVTTENPEEDILNGGKT